MDSRHPMQKRPLCSWSALVKSMRKHDPRVRVIKTDTERRIVDGAGVVLAQFPLSMPAQEAIIHLATPKLPEKTDAPAPSP